MRVSFGVEVLQDVEDLGCQDEDISRMDAAIVHGPGELLEVSVVPREDEEAVACVPEDVGSVGNEMGHAERLHLLFFLPLFY